jgi:transposase
MAERFVEVDRNTPMLLPADLRDWVPEDDLVHFVIEAVKTLPTGEFVINERGTGYAQYPPSMMLALLIYCYASGIFSSRRIERASYRDLGVRFLTGDTHPDHDTICSFRRQNGELIAKFFCAGVGVGSRTEAFAGGHPQRRWHSTQSQWQ